MGWWIMNDWEKYWEKQKVVGKTYTKENVMAAIRITWLYPIIFDGWPSRIWLENAIQSMVNPQGCLILEDGEVIPLDDGQIQDIVELFPMEFANPHAVFSTPGNKTEVEPIMYAPMKMDARRIYLSSLKAISQAVIDLENILGGL